MNFVESPFTQALLVELIAELRARKSDTTTVEIKSAVGGCPHLGPTLCAFGNMPEGGTIILGLDEAADFAPVGLDDVAVLEQGVASQARTTVIPPVRCDFSTLRIDGNDVLVCQVEGLPLHDRPVRYSGQAYLRQSDGDYAMSEQEIAQIELQKTQAVRRTHPDAQAVPESSRHDLDPNLVVSFLAAARSSSKRHADVSDEEILVRLGVLSAKGEVTLAGLYALGAYPQKFQRTLGVTAAVQLPPKSGARTRDLAHLDGPLPDLLDQATEWVRRNTRDVIRYDERGHAADYSELPMRAVREIVANALIHRNLDPITDSKRVEIRLLDDKLVITSPGGLWGVSEQQLGKPNGKSAVNLALYDICKLVRMPDGSRVIEGEGGGIREAMLAMREAGLRPPEFIDAGVRFTALLSRHTLLDDADLHWLAELPQAEGLTSEQRAVLASMRRGVTWTNAMVREQFAPMDSTDARRLLQRLVEFGLAEQTGARRGAGYQLAASLRQEMFAAYEDHELEAAPVHVKALGAHVPMVWAALAQPKTFRQLQAAVGLTDRQVRYVLNQLRRAGEVVFAGRQGSREARYHRVESGK